MTIQFSKKALKDLEAVPAKDEAKLIADINRLAALPHAGRLAEMAADVGCNVTPIKDGFRLRHGDWRALMVVEGDAVTVQRVLNRKEAYR